MKIIFKTQKNEDWETYLTLDYDGYNTAPSNFRIISFQELGGKEAIEQGLPKHTHGALMELQIPNSHYNLIKIRHRIEYRGREEYIYQIWCDRQDIYKILMGADYYDI